MRRAAFPAVSAARPAQWNSWRWQLAHACATPPGGAAAERVAAKYPFIAVPYALELARKCPGFAKQVFPDPRELEPDGFPADPFGEGSGAAVAPGLKRRYPDRVLAMACTACAMRCRHCTRKGILGCGAQTLSSPGNLERAAAWVAAHRAVRDVLLSGGDPLVLPDSKVARMVDAFAAIEHVDIVRVCTRAPCTLPMRITKGLVKTLSRSRKVWVNTHFNCAGELTPEAVRACGMLVDAGIPVSCQTVLLKGVNDTPAAMEKLLRALVRARVRPYYVFVCDPVAGIPHLRVPAEKAREIEKAVALRIGGLALPRFVADIPGAGRKTPLQEI